jgi:uncharacterized membrane protein YsdA (DUF1294 family)
MTRMTAILFPDLLRGLYAVLNIIAFFVSTNDKRKAKSNEW